MKKILLSLSMIAVVGVIVLGATGAFFSDTETSTGNTFTAGAIDLTVDSEQHYNGNICVENQNNAEGQPDYVWSGGAPYPLAGTACGGTWGQDEGLNIVNEKFFDFGDIKPGDWGENTISLHVVNNDAYACVDITNMTDLDNSCTEPEEGSSDACTVSTPEGTTPGAGELAEGTNFFAWADDGDNVFEGLNNPGFPEFKLFSNTVGPASDVLNGTTYTLADGGTGTPLPGGSTQYIGLGWCAGTLTVTDLNTGGWTCNGASMGNETQTDSFSADVSFRVEQARNNSAFRCDGSHL